MRFELCYSLQLYFAVPSSTYTLLISKSSDLQLLHPPRYSITNEPCKSLVRTLRVPHPRYPTTNRNIIYFCFLVCSNNDKFQEVFDQYNEHIEELGEKVFLNNFGDIPAENFVFMMILVQMSMRIEKSR